MRIPISINLQIEALGVPNNEKEMAQLEKNLHMMGCHGLLMKLWNFQDKEMVKELKIEKLSK